MYVLPCIIQLVLIRIADAVEPSTILNAVLWKEASRFPDLRIRMQAAYFEHAQKKLSLNTEVGKITESAGQRVVTLVLPA